MIRQCLCVFVFFAVCSSFSIPEKLSKKADKVIAKFYQTKDFTKEAIAISEVMNAETVSEFGNENLFRISSNDTILG